MQFIKNYYLLSLLMIMLFFAACKKTDVQANNLATAPTGGTGSSVNYKDTAVDYARDIYLWYNLIPSTFNTQSYSDLNGVMTAIRQYSIEPGFSSAVDRWSFAVKKQEWDNVSSGVGGDFGLSVFFKSEGDLRVKLVEPESPAGKAGIKRGWRISTINGNNNITTSNADFIVQNVFNSTNSSFTFIKPDNSTVNLTLTATSYQTHPVILDSVYSVNGKNIGYFAFNSFLGDTTVIYNNFAQTFNRFASANVNDVIVDLRYNGGGYVSVSEKLADFLAPSSANGALMMTQKYNDKYSQFNELTYFHKLGNLNLSRIFFIVSNSTASASELLINNLRPYMNVNLSGASKTYGKPVGFFPIPVGDSYIFPVSFRTTNKNGEGNYFSGLALNNQVADGLDKNWGDLTESGLASVINYIVNGVYGKAVSARAIAEAEAQLTPQVLKSNEKLDEPDFKGSITTHKWK